MTKTYTIDTGDRFGIIRLAADSLVEARNRARRMFGRHAMLNTWPERVADSTPASTSRAVRSTHGSEVKNA